MAYALWVMAYAYTITHQRPSPGTRKRGSRRGYYLRYLLGYATIRPEGQMTPRK